MTSVTSLDDSALRHRYKDAYSVADSTIAVASLLKTAGAAGAVLSVPLAYGLSEVLEFSPGFALTIGAGALAIGIQVYALGILVAALGQILRATLDTAVNTTALRGENATNGATASTGSDSVPGGSDIDTQSWKCVCGITNDPGAPRCVCGRSPKATL